MWDESMGPLKCIALKRKAERPGEEWDGLFQWLTCNGMNAGRWTLYFGPPCLADSSDCRSIVAFNKELNPESEIVNFEIKLEESTK